MISVVIPAYNYADFLPDAIDSVLSQGVQDLQIIICDDCSTDNTENVVKKYLSDHRIKYIRHAKNLGAVPNINFSINLATGQYVLLLGADDQLAPGAILKLKSVLEKNSAIDFAYGKYSFVNKCGVLTGLEHWGWKDKNYVGNRDEFPDLLRYDLYINLGATLFRRRVLEGKPFFDIDLVALPEERFFRATDFDLMLRLSLKGCRSAFVNDCVAYFRQHDAQASGDKKYAGTGIALLEYIVLLERYLISEYSTRFIHVLPEIINLLVNKYNYFLSVSADVDRARIMMVNKKYENIISNVKNKFNLDIQIPQIELPAHAISIEMNSPQALNNKEYEVICDDEAKTPFFSIVVTTFNRSFLLGFALDSLRRQSFKDFEVIVVNDAGEHVEYLLEQYVDLNVIYIRHGRNQGPSAARNSALKLAKGKYVCYLDDDDLFMSNHLNVLHSHCSNNPNSVFYTSAVYVLERIENNERIEIGRNYPFEHDNFSLKDLLIQNYIPVNTFCHPLGNLEEIKLFDVDLMALEDWDFLLELTKKYQFSHINEVTVEVRLREKEISPEDQRSNRQRKDFPSIFRKIYKKNNTQADLYVEEGRAKLLSELDAEMGMLRTEKLAVIFHLFYLEQWEEITVLLKNIPIDFDLIVTTTPENQDQVGNLLTQSYPAAKLYITENRGRDIGPLVTLLQYENLAKYDFICKLHTKKSLHLDPEFAQKWRNEVLISLLPSPDGVKAILDLFNARPEVGIVAGAGALVHAHYTPGGNINLLRELATRLGFNLDEIAYEFPGGSMFWCRGRVFDSLRSLNITVDDFEPELGQTNGTLAHAIERLFPLIAYHQGLLTVDAGYQGNVPNPRFPNSSEEYLHWLNQQKLSESEAKHFDIHAESTVMPKVTICIIDRFGDKNLVIKTIKSISQQLYSNLNVMICSAAENPMPGGGLDWIKTSQDFYSTCLNFNHDCDWLGFLEAGDELTLSGLLLAMHQIVDKEEWKSVYFDDDVINLDGRPACPRFKPDFDINLIRSMPYADGFLLLRHDQLELLQSIKTDFFGCEQIAVLLSIYECYGAQSIGHVSELVVHLNINDARVLSNLTRYQAFVGLIHEHFDRLGIVAEILENQRVEGAVRIQYAISDSPLVSIIIPTKNQLPMLQRCLESILEKTSYQTYEIIVVDNQSDDPQVAPYLQQLESILAGKLRVLSYPHAFNFSAINNFAVSQARGEYLVLLNNDTAMIQSSWLDELLHHAARTDVGVVGAKLLYPSGLVQHAGVVLGLRGPADHPCIGAAHESSGYMHRLQLEQNYSAVTAACLMIRRSVYLQVGGMNEVDFKVSYNDVDLCLKVGELGLLVVWTPFSVVLHEGSVSQNTVDVAKQAEKLRRFQSEQQAMYAKWSSKIGNDPAYNKNLTLSGNGFELEHRALLSWNPLTWQPAPKILCHPADQMGCGNYRLIQPFLALENELKITGSLTFELLPPFELAKYNPDVMIFQRQITEQQLEFMRQARSCNSSFKIYELDDYLPNLPLKSAHREQMPKDVLKSLRKALTMVDRFVVSTDELANAYSGLHSNIHVVNNYLSPSVWGGVLSARRQSKKPRVGWAGGVSHTGDLELISDVVKELAAEVEWVFFGMCPEKLRPYVHEFHAGVPINEYPAKLASLNLDVALAPLEHNLFNRCKSNLRLLEYGVCGYPVICTDIEPYAHHLPVTRVKNKHKDWVDAIRAHTTDLDHAARMGDKLKFAVNKDWMLREHNLDLWLAAWSGVKS